MNDKKHKFRITSMRKKQYLNWPRPSFLSLLPQMVITGIKSVEYKNKQSLFCYTCEAIDLFDEETVKKAMLKQRVKDLNLRLIK